MTGSELTLQSDCLELYFWTVTFETMVILQKDQSLSNQRLKHNSAHMPSLYLTLGFNLNLGLVCSSLTVTTQKANVCSLGLLVFAITIWMKKANNFQIPKVQTQFCFALVLFFYQIQPGVACKSVGCL